MGHSYSSSSSTGNHENPVNSEVGWVAPGGSRLVVSYDGVIVAISSSQSLTTAQWTALLPQLQPVSSNQALRKAHRGTETVPPRYHRRPGGALPGVVADSVPRRRGGAGAGGQGDRDQPSPVDWRCAPARITSPGATQARRRQTDLQVSNGLNLRGVLCHQGLVLHGATERDLRRRRARGASFRCDHRRFAIPDKRRFARGIDA